MKFEIEYYKDSYETDSIMKISLNCVYQFNIGDIINPSTWTDEVYAYEYKGECYEVIKIMPLIFNPNNIKVCLLLKEYK